MRIDIIFGNNLIPKVKTGNGSNVRIPKGKIRYCHFVCVSNE